MKTNTKAASDKDKTILINTEHLLTSELRTNVMKALSILFATLFLYIKQRLKIAINRIKLTSERP